MMLDKSCFNFPMDLNLAVQKAERAYEKAETLAGLLGPDSTEAVAARDLAAQWALFVESLKG